MILSLLFSLASPPLPATLQGPPLNDVDRRSLDSHRSSSRYNGIANIAFLAGTGNDEAASYQVAVS